MFEINSIEDIELVSETSELECKKALGRDGRGEVPKEMWETYSAFANTYGGYILLGVIEKSGEFIPKGIPDSDQLVTDIFNNLNNPQKVSCNTIGNADVKQIPGPNGNIIVIKVPAATRKQKPVYLNNNPFGNTYKRLHSGDRKCDDETVKRMLAEQQFEDRDGKVFTNFSLPDIDQDTLVRFRTMLKNKKTDHPFLELNHLDFLKRISGYKRDRETKREGLTLAGLLMFGKWEAIQEAVPNYFVDYQERPEAKTEMRWIDRVVPDGTWSGNLFDFYKIVYRKLTTDIKVPFSLKGGQRKEDTPVHEAIREALINTLVHADYSISVPILVVKRPDMFGFRNPGLMRIPIEQAYGGGISDCRNKLMHQMFLMVGLGERAGSGIPKIIQNWDKQHWRLPFLYERLDPEQTLLEMRMQSLIPEETLNELKSLFGDAFESLNQLELLILATAEIEGVISHQRIQTITEKHAHDISITLQNLVKKDLLVPTGKTRARTYCLPGQSPVKPEDIFNPWVEKRSEQENVQVDSSEHLEFTSEHSESSSEHIAQKSGNNQEKKRDKLGRLLTSEFEYPVVDKLDMLSTEFLDDLFEIAKEPREKGRVGKGVINHVVIKLCSDQFVTLNALAEIVNRNSDGLRQRYIKPLIEEGKMKMAFPSTPNHEKQAYRSIKRDTID